MNSNDDHGSDGAAEGDGMSVYARIVMGDDAWQEGEPRKTGWYWVCRHENGTGGYSVVFVTGVGSMLEWQAVCPNGCDLSWRHDWPWGSHCKTSVPSLEHNIVLGDGEQATE